MAADRRGPLCWRLEAPLLIAPSSLWRFFNLNTYSYAYKSEDVLGAWPSSRFVRERWAFKAYVTWLCVCGLCRCDRLLTVFSECGELGSEGDISQVSNHLIYCYRELNQVKATSDKVKENYRMQMISKGKHKWSKAYQKTYRLLLVWSLWLIKHQVYAFKTSQLLSFLVLSSDVFCQKCSNMWALIWGRKYEVETEKDT